jgi:hypothetical protein
LENRKEQANRIDDFERREFSSWYKFLKNCILHEGLYEFFKVNLSCYTIVKIINLLIKNIHLIIPTKSLKKCGRCLYFFLYFPSPPLHTRKQSLRVPSEPAWIGLVVKAWDLAVCSSQGLRFKSSWCHFMCWVSPYRAKLWL